VKQKELPMTHMPIQNEDKLNSKEAAGLQTVGAKRSGRTTKKRRDQLNLEGLVRTWRLSLTLHRS
jgi:hypothetical protein